MQTSNKERTLSWISNQYKKGNISFSHKLQRPVGLWNTKMKSYLIHSLLVGYPVNPIYVVTENDVTYTLDGSQRTSSCIDFINGDFALYKDTPKAVIKFKENGETISKEFDIAGKKFDKLDDEVKETLLAACLTFCTLTDYTDEEVREMFKRQNTSQKLSNPHSRVVLESEEFRNAISILTEHPFMSKLLSDKQRRKGLDKDILIQSLMLICTDDDHDFTSFRTKDIDKFIVEYGDTTLVLVSTLTSVMDMLDSSLDEMNISLSSIPMILYAGYMCIQENKSFEKFVTMINEFIENYDSNESYKQYTQSGTSNSEMVRGRFEYWKNLLNEL